MAAPDRQSSTFDFARHCAALLIALAWTGIYVYWLLTRDTPACHITTVQVAHVATITRSCGLPSLPDGLYALVPVALLLLADVDSVAWRGGSIRRRRAARRTAPAVPAVRDAAAGNTPGQAQDAGSVADEIEGG